MSRKGSKKGKPLLKDGVRNGVIPSPEVNQMNENLGYKEEEEEIERKKLAPNECDSSALNEIELQQRKVLSGTRAKSDNANTMNNNLQEIVEENQYSTLDRANKQQQQSGQVQTRKEDINTTKKKTTTPGIQTDSTVGYNTRQQENMYSTLNRAASKEGGLYNPHAVDSANVEVLLPRKMVDNQAKTAIYDSITDKKDSENDYSTLNRKPSNETAPQIPPARLAVPGLRPDTRAVKNDYSSLHRKSRKNPPPKPPAFDSKDAAKSLPAVEGNDATYAKLEQRKEPESAYNTLDRTLSQENFLNRASWASTDSLLYNPYAVDDAESVASLQWSQNKKHNISNPMYDHLEERQRPTSQCSAQSGTCLASSASNTSDSGIVVRETHTNRAFVGDYEENHALYSELTNFQGGATTRDTVASSEASYDFWPGSRWLRLNYCVPVMLFIVLFLSVIALLLVILIIAGKAGPGCSDSCKGPVQSQLANFAPDGSSLLQLIDELRRNVSVTKNISETTVQFTLDADVEFIREQNKLNTNVVTLRQKDEQNNIYLFTVNDSTMSGTTAVTTKVESSLETLKSQDKSLQASFAGLNSTVTTDESNMLQKVKDTEASARSLSTGVETINSTLPMKDEKLHLAIQNGNANIVAIQEGITKMVQAKANQIYPHLHLVNSTQKTEDSVISASLATLSTNFVTFNTSLTLQVDNLKKTLKGRDEEIQDALLALNTTLNTKIFQISQMLGPKGIGGNPGSNGIKGLQGAKGQDGPGDFTKCSYHVTSSSNGQTPIDHILFDSDSNLAGKTIIGLVCSSNVDRVTYRLMRESNRWRCYCKRDPGTSIKCFIHYWVCPTS